MTYSWNVVSKYFGFEFIRPSHVSRCDEQGVSFHCYPYTFFFSPNFSSIIHSELTSCHFLRPFQRIHPSPTIPHTKGRGVAINAMHPPIAMTLLRRCIWYTLPKGSFWLHTTHLKGTISFLKNLLPKAGTEVAKWVGCHSQTTLAVDEVYGFYR